MTAPLAAALLVVVVAVDAALLVACAMTEHLRVPRARHRKS